MNAFGFLYPCTNNVVNNKRRVGGNIAKVLYSSLILTLRDGLVHYIKEVGVDVI